MTEGEKVRNALRAALAIVAQPERYGQVTVQTAREALTDVSYVRKAFD